MKLSIEQMGMIKKEYSNNNPLSAFSRIKEAEGNFKISDEEKALLDVISNPERSSKVILQERDVILEKYGYLKGDKLVLAENAGGELVVNNSDAIPEAVSHFAEFIGICRMTAADVDITLNKNEVLVFMALIDIYRERIMAIRCGKQEELSFTFGEIRNHLENPLESSLVSVFKVNYKIEVPKEENIKPILNTLTEKKVIIFDKKFMLVDEYALMATSFIDPTIIINLETFELSPSNEPIGSSALFISAGIKSNLLFLFGDGVIEMMEVSSSYMLDVIERFLKCPKLS